jgi:hypothetical protein
MLVPRKKKKETAMKQSRPIEVIRPTLRRRALGKGLPIANVLTLGAALLAIVLSVTLSSAAGKGVCVRPLDVGPDKAPLSAPCDYR